RGSESATPAPGVLEAIQSSDLVVIAPSNPPLSIWPILAIPPIRQAVASHHSVMAVSPLFGGRALKGPADRVMASLGLPPGNRGVVEAYRGLIGTIVIDRQDSDDADLLEDVEVMVTDTRIGDVVAARRLASEMIAR
ncbi:MAG TPA: 2-phospho-L-lactate transferase CofD family protein, partial [Acidimicrobiia bacterium]